jgi:hypothetical protein
MYYSIYYSIGRSTPSQFIAITSLGSNIVSTILTSLWVYLCKQIRFRNWPPPPPRSQVVYLPSLPFSESFFSQCAMWMGHPMQAKKTTSKNLSLDFIWRRLAFREKKLKIINIWLRVCISGWKLYRGESQCMCENLRSFIITFIHPSPFAEASFNFLLCTCVLRGKNLPVRVNFKLQQHDLYRP